MRKMLLLTSLVLAVVLSFPLGSYAAPVFGYDLAFIENRPADDVYGVTGLRVQLDVGASDPLGPGALTGPGAHTTATSSNGSFPFAQPVTLPFNSSYSLTGVLFTTNLLLSGGIADFPKVTGTYDFTVTNTSAQSTSSTSHNLDKPEAIPIPTGLHTSNQSTSPVFSFTDPNPTPGISGLVRRYEMFVVDGITHAALYDSGGASTTPNILIPDGIMLPEHPYFLRAISLDIDTTETATPLNNRLENRSNEYLSFTPVPEPGSLLLLGSGLAALAGSAWRRHRRK